MSVILRAASLALLALAVYLVFAGRWQAVLPLALGYFFRGAAASMERRS